MDETTLLVKDANDLLKAWVREGAPAEVQVERVRQMLASSPTLVEEAARWAGGREGADRDQAIHVVFGLVGGMDRMEKAYYRGRLANALGVGLREFNDLAKAAVTADVEREARVTTLGGFYNGWLVEYVFDGRDERARLAWRDADGKVGIGEQVEIEGVTYVPRDVNGFVRDGGVIFASDLGQLKSTRELVAIIETFINQHYLLENKYLGKIISYYVLMTWVYDAFNALPYLRAMGEAGSGKSELMRRIGYLCYRTMMASGANTAASFFRATEMYRGTVFIDEADLHDGGDMSNDLVKFLNLGAMKGNPIWRLEEAIDMDGKKTFEPATFSTFCPKLIAMRKDFKDDAVGSRSLTIKLMPREPVELKARGIRLYIDDEFRAKAEKIRNLLLRWRFAHWEVEIPVTEELMDLDISSRLNQVTMPLKALAKDDEELQGEIVRFLRAYNMEIVLSRSMTIAARVVEAIWKIYTYPDLRKRFLWTGTEGDEYMLIGDVRTIANEIMDEMNKTVGDDEEDGEEKVIVRRKKDELSARGVGSIIRNELQLHVGARRGNGFPVAFDRLKLEALAKRYGVEIPVIQEQPEQGNQGVENLRML